MLPLPTADASQACGGGPPERSPSMLGIDVSKDQLTCAFLDPTSKQLRWERTVPNSPQGIRQLLQATPSEAPWVLEPTGRYSAPIARQARAAGRAVLLAVPRRAQHFLESLPKRAKTDKLDSRGLGLYALSVPLPDYPLPTPAVERLQQLLTV